MSWERKWTGLCVMMMDYDPSADRFKGHNLCWSLPEERVKTIIAQLRALAGEPDEVLLDHDACMKSAESFDSSGSTVLYRSGEQ